MALRVVDPVTVKRFKRCLHSSTENHQEIIPDTNAHRPSGGNGTDFARKSMSLDVSQSVSTRNVPMKGHSAIKRLVRVLCSTLSAGVAQSSSGRILLKISHLRSTLEKNVTAKHSDETPSA